MNHRRHRSDLSINFQEILFQAEESARVAEETKKGLRQDFFELSKVYELGDQTELSKRCITEAVSGNFSAEFICVLGCMYFDGDYFEENTPKACHYFEMAYESGERHIRPGDYLMMGSYRHYEVEDGRRYGLYRDMNLALKWYELGARSAPELYSNVGCAYLEKEIRDYKKAYDYFFKAGMEDTRAKLYLGFMYEYGLYVERDFEKAKMLFSFVLQDCEREGRGAGDVFYDRAVNGLNEISGRVHVLLTKEHFEMLIDKSML